MLSYLNQELYYFEQVQLSLYYVYFSIVAETFLLRKYVNTFLIHLLVGLKTHRLIDFMYVSLGNKNLMQVGYQRNALWEKYMCEIIWP